MTNFLNWKKSLPENLKLYKRDKERNKEISDREIIHHQKIIEKENSIALTAYINEIKKYKKISIKRQNKLFKKINEGDVRSREKLIKGSLSRVVHIAQDNYDGKISLEDLIQEGNIGLFLSVDKYLKGNFKNFVSYSSFWIYQRLTRYISDCQNTIRIPVHLYEKLLILKKYQKNNPFCVINRASMDEIFSKTKIPINVLLTISSLPKKISFKKLIKINLNNIYNDDYLYKPMFDDSLVRSLNEVLSTLDERERKVLNLRFGLDDGEAKTLEEIGKIFGVTRERIRQIEAKAVRKLRHPSRRKKIIDFY
jgi:RNA polymerase primary sigma factor